MSTYDDASLIYYPSGYKAGTAYSLKPTDGSGDLTFTRASTATRVNAAGLIESVATGVPRIDYTGGGCGKLLLEPQRTNVVLQSENLDSGAWPTNNITSINSDFATSPSGATTADKINYGSGNGFIRTNSTLTAASSASIFVKYVDFPFIQIMMSGDANHYANFDIQNGTIGSVGSASTAAIEDYGNGWYRIILNALTGTFNGTARFYKIDTLAKVWAQGGGVAGSFLMWGGQLELGSYPTSYIPTTTTAVTRTQDTATKGSIDSLIGQTEGTIFVDMNIDAWDSSSFYFGVYGGGNEIYFACVGTGFLRFKHYGGGTTLAQIQQSGFALGRHKLAARYKNNDWAFYVDGVLIGVDTSGTFSGLIGFCSLGYSSPAAYPSNAKYNSAMVFPTALSNAELATLTTL
jgi:hypothetical protein